MIGKSKAIIGCFQCFVLRLFLIFLRFFLVVLRFSGNISGSIIVILGHDRNRDKPNCFNVKVPPPPQAPTARHI